MKVSVRKIPVSEIGRSDRVASEMSSFIFSSILSGDVKISDLSFGVRNRSQYSAAYRNIRPTHDVAKYDALTELLRQDVERISPEHKLKRIYEQHLNMRISYRECV